MDYSLSIPERNVQQHIDLEKEIQNKGNGLLTFTIRVAGGMIRDLSVIEYVERRDRTKTIVVKEFGITRTFGTGDEEDALR
jgi:hypothetical protein